MICLPNKRGLDLNQGKDKGTFQDLAGTQMVHGFDTQHEGK